jgi:hypothetical protein
MYIDLTLENYENFLMHFACSYGRLHNIFDAKYCSLKLYKEPLYGKRNRQQELDTVSERAKLGVLYVLLLLALLFTGFAASNTFQAVRNLQLQNSSVRAGDVSTIRAWMTIIAVSHIYHVPEDFVYRSLGLSSNASFHRATLNEIARRKRQPVDEVIHTLQHAILTYRKEHPGISTPTQAHHSSMKHPSTTPRRVEH